MKDLKDTLSDYLLFCKTQKRLDAKTMKAYQIDLRQFILFHSFHLNEALHLHSIEQYIAMLHQTYKPKTVRRKIASLKAFFRYMEYRDLLEINPFNKLQIKFREPIILPKIIPLHVIKMLFTKLYAEQKTASTNFQKKCICRDIAVIELLFSTGIRISELCALRLSDMDFIERTLLIHGKGAKERHIQIGSDEVMKALINYKTNFKEVCSPSDYFFINRLNQRLSEQSVRNMIHKYAKSAGIDMHITPHMFRHSFATCLLEEDVDIRYIQKMLGHSSIHITEIYTHVTMAKQKDILRTKHPRNRLFFQ